MGLRKSEEPSALAFGSAIHKALEYWYQLPAAERLLPSSLEEQAGLYAFGHALESPVSCGALEAIRQFVLCRFDNLSGLPETDKRSLSSGVRILKAYFKHYATDGYSVYRDADGPLIERTVEFPMYEDASIKVTYFGTIDVVLQHEKTGVICITDHKTTSALGKEFYDRCRPNHQYTGYVLGAREALGINTNLFMINGVQVAKTKVEFARQITDRNEDDFEELKASVVQAAYRWVDADSREKTDGYRKCYPMSAPNACSMYGGCQYRPICEVPENLKQNVIKMQYGG